jgi:hypothetical protein
VLEWPREGRGTGERERREDVRRDGRWERDGGGGGGGG